MSHTVRQKEKLIARVRGIRGQMEGIERALESKAGCAEVLRQIASVRGAMNGLTSEVMEGHLRQHVLAAETDAARREGGEELVEVIRTYIASRLWVLYGSSDAGRSSSSPPRP